LLIHPGVAHDVLNGIGIDEARVREAVKKALESGQRSSRDDVFPIPRVRKILELSASEASRLNSEKVGTEHILLGLSTEGDSVGAHVLEDLGVPSERITKAVEAAL